MTLFARFAIPLYRFGFILSYAFAVVVATSKKILRFGVTLLGSFAKPLYRFGLIHFYAFAVIVARA